MEDGLMFANPRRTWVAVLLAGVALLLVGGAGRLVYIQHTRGDDLRGRATAQQTTRIMLPALRGEILDARGRVLAGTVRRASVFVDPVEVRDLRYAAHRLGPVLDLSADDIAGRVEEAGGTRFMWLKRRLSAEQAESFVRLKAAGGLRGFELQHELERVYPQDWLAAHVLGFVGVDLRPPADGLPAFEDLRGLEGIEAAYDDLLRGQPGWKEVIVDVRRRRVGADQQDQVPAVDGAAVVLTIDATVQQIVEEELQAACEEHQPEWGTAVVIEPHSGEILAMATVPTFDPAAAIPVGLDRMTTAERDELKALWRNRAITDAYEPGSIFKPVIASSAVEAGMTRLGDKFAVNGRTHDFGYRSVSDTHVHGVLTLREVISLSSNIGMGLLGARCEMRQLHEWVTAFGFGRTTGIGLPGESAGLVNPLEVWNPRFSPQSVPIGQELAVTAVQMVTAFAPFANGGELLQPRIVRGVVRADGKTLRDNSSRLVRRRVLSTETAARFRQEALVLCVTDGTGKQAALEAYQVFGKTGTAEIAWADRAGYEPGKYVGSFIGGAPASDPRVVVLVSLYKPSRGKYYGGTVAGPAVGQILQRTLAYLQVPSERPVESDMKTARRP
jgi:stage V sporulation protein D (sporulation-specific penicillin-binding protein)